MVVAATREKLRSFDTPTICNLVELFEVRPRNTGYMDGRIRAAFPEIGPIVGFAATATFRADAPPCVGATYQSLDSQVERFGEVMCTTYQAFGAIGLITSGAGRDLDQVRAINFPVFTGGTICAHGYCHTPQIHVPVRAGGITVMPNDLLHADRSGVTTIPQEIAAELADVGDEFVAAEGIMLDAVRGSVPTIARRREAAEEAAATIAELRARVSRGR